MNLGPPTASWAKTWNMIYSMVYKMYGKMKKNVQYPASISSFKTNTCMIIQYFEFVFTTTFHLEYRIVRYMAPMVQLSTTNS